VPGTSSPRETPPSDLNRVPSGRGKGTLPPVLTTRWLTKRVDAHRTTKRVKASPVQADDRSCPHQPASTRPLGARVLSTCGPCRISNTPRQGVGPRRVVDFLSIAPSGPSRTSVCWPWPSWSGVRARHQVETDTGMVRWTVLSHRHLLFGVARRTKLILVASLRFGVSPAALRCHPSPAGLAIRSVGLTATRVVGTFDRPEWDVRPSFAVVGNSIPGSACRRRRRGTPWMRGTFGSVLASRTSRQ